MQVLRAAKALLKAVEKLEDNVKSEKSGKPGLFDEEDSDDKETPIWLVFTAKNHILDSQRLKPGKMYEPIFRPVFAATDMLL